MLDSLAQLAFPLQALVATLLTWALTALGACVVFLIRLPNQNVMDAMLGLAGGVMVAAAFWSLLSPAIDMAQALGMVPWLTVFVGFLGAAFCCSSATGCLPNSKKNGPCFSRTRRRPTSNAAPCWSFPSPCTTSRKGWPLGVAFGSLAYGLEGSTAAGAWMLALGIGLQNLPEGMAVSLPPSPGGILSPTGLFLRPTQRRGGTHRCRAGGPAGPENPGLPPFLLAFAAGAMIYVVVEELIPESQTNENKDWMALFTLVGFSVMMVLDVALG